jgi:hypothetical protein
MDTSHGKYTQIVTLAKHLLLTVSLTMVLTNFSACSEEQMAEGTGAISRFDEVIWKAQLGSQAADNPRAKMLVDLKENYIKIGMMQTEVEAILGKADRMRNGQHLYRLGMGRFAADYSYLALVYDEVGRLKAVLDARS